MNICDRLYSVSLCKHYVRTYVRVVVYGAFHWDGLTCHTVRMYICTHVCQN